MKLTFSHFMESYAVAAKVDELINPLTKDIIKDSTVILHIDIWRSEKDKTIGHRIDIRCNEIKEEYGDDLIEPDLWKRFPEIGNKLLAQFVTEYIMPPKITQVVFAEIRKRAKKDKVLKEWLELNHFLSK